MVLPYISMNLSWVYTCSNPESPSHLPPHTISLSQPSAPAPSILYPASNLDWRFVSYMILYMFQCLQPWCFKDKKKEKHSMLIWWERTTIHESTKWKVKTFLWPTHIHLFTNIITILRINNLKYKYNGVCNKLHL